MNNSKIIKSSDQTSKSFFDLSKRFPIENSDLFNEISGNAGELNLAFHMKSASVKEYVSALGISERVFFHAAFAFSLSRFTGCENVIYNSFDWVGCDFSNENKPTHAMPIISDCSDDYINNYLIKFNSLVSEFAVNYRGLDNNITKENDIKSYILFDFNSNLSLTKNQHNIYNLDVKVFQHGDSYAVSVKHSDRYSSDLIEKFTSVFISVSSQFLKLNKLSDINLVDKDDLSIQSDANNTFKKINKIDVVKKFKEIVNNYPNNICLIHEDFSYTYDQVDKMTDYLAWWMNNSDIKQQDSVVILTERSYWYILLILACLKADITYIPIDSVLPKQRIDSIIEHSNSKCIFVSNGTWELAKDLQAKTLVQNVDNLKFENHKFDIVEHDQSSLACILFTSGSTSIPKGVCINRSAYDNEIVFYAKQFNISSEDIYGLYASIGYSPHRDCLCTLIVGGAITVVPAEIRLDMAQLNQYFEKYNVTVTFLTSSLLYQFATSQNNKSLRIVFRGGEKPKVFNNKCNFRIQDEFGCTECGDIFQISSNDKDHTNELGYSIANTEVYVLDGNLNKLPLFAIGELCVGGIPAKSHYLSKDKGTINKFIKNPYDDGYLFRTGDYACFLGNGRVYNLGRRDHLVKIRGNRVDVSEVEKTINELDYVMDSHVLAVKNNNNSNVLVAYIVPNDSFIGDDDELQNGIVDDISKKLPFYMIPSHFIFIDKIPYNINGKVDTKALPSLDINEISDDYIAPFTATQKDVCKAFKKALNINRVGINDDFVLLGGDSLAAIDVVSSLNNEHIKVIDIFNYKTAKNLSEYIDKIKIESSNNDNSKELFAPVLNGACHFLHASIGNEYIPYNEVFHVTIKDKSVLEVKKAIEHIYSAHPGLRINIHKHNDWYYMDGRKENPLDITISQLDMEPDSDFFSNLVRKIDVFDDKLLRVKLFVYKDDVHVFVEFNHIIIDGHSVNVLLGQLVSYLSNNKIEPEKFDVFDISAREQLYYKSDNVDNDIKYYKKIYSEYEFTSFPMSAKAGENIVGDYVMDTDELDSEVVDAACAKLSISPSNLFLTALAITLHNYKKENKILINRIFSDRNVVTDKNTVACLVPRRPVCCQINNDDTFIDVEDKIDDFMKDELKHEQIYKFYKETGLCDKKIKYCVIYNYMDFINLKEKTKYPNLDFSCEVIDYNRINPYPYGVSVEIIRQKEKYIINFRYDNLQYDKKVLSCARLDIIKLIKTLL